MAHRDGNGGVEPPPIPAYATRILSLVSDFKRSLSVRAHVAARADTVDIDYLDHLAELYGAVTSCDDVYRHHLGYPISDSLPEWVEHRDPAL